LFRANPHDSEFAIVEFIAKAGNREFFSKGTRGNLFFAKNGFPANSEKII
jgi:hypothetical protein